MRFFQSFGVLFSLFFISGPSIGAITHFSEEVRPYQAQHYRIEITIDPSTDPNEFEASVQMQLKTTADTQEIALDTEALKIKSVELLPQKKPVTFSAQDPKRLLLTLPKIAKKGTPLKFLITYSGVVNTGHRGIFKVTDPDDASRGPLIFSHFEPIEARAYFPCDDQPSAKATTELLATVPLKYQVVSNGKLVKDQKLKDGKTHQVHWLQDKPHATYLVSLAVAPFTKVTGKLKKPEVSMWVGPSKAALVQYSLESTEDALKFYEEYLGVKYPWAKYASVGIPTFNWGGMENTSATHMNEERLILVDPNSGRDRSRSYGLVAHELAHQWFGDLVTMKEWKDVWLNESFASYMQFLASSNRFKNDDEAIDLATVTWDRYFREDNGPRSHAVVDKDLSNPESAFDATNYIKGENVLRMLSAQVGEANFRKALKLYLTQHRYGNAKYTELFDALKQVSGEDLSELRDSWLLQRGYPVVSYGGKWNSSSGTYTLTLRQKSNHDEDKNLWVFRMPVVLHRKTTPAFEKTVFVSMSKASQSQDVALPAAPEWVSVNPGAVIPAKVVQEERDEAILALQAAGDSDAVSRAWANYDLLLPLYEGQKISQKAERTLCDTISNDPSPYVRIAILSKLQRIKGRWLPTRLEDTVLSLAETATQPAFAQTDNYRADAFGWGRYRASLLGTLGRIDSNRPLPLLTKVLMNPKLALDDLASASYATASLGAPEAAEALKAAYAVHEKRGYKYRFPLQVNFGAYQSPSAVVEIREFYKAGRNDIMGKIGWLISDNEPLKNSKEWAGFTKDFVLSGNQFDDEVKSRILSTIEEVKSDNVKDALQSIVKETPSERLKAESQKILEKNFPTGSAKS